MLLKAFVASLTGGFLLAGPASALAQGPRWQLPAETARYRDAGDAQLSYYDARRTAYDNGYREGLRRGEQDARRGDRFAYQDEREFQRADSGYHRRLGDRDRYRLVFREGFAAGYRDGFSRLARYGRTDQRRGPYGQSGYGRGSSGPYGGYGAAYGAPAFENGARDGYEKGLEDARKNRSFDPVRHSWYRSGDRHYQSRYGSRDQYKDVYRRGFQQGYDRGYQEARFRR